MAQDPIAFSEPERPRIELVRPLPVVADSAPMQRLVQMARRVARVDSTVLVTGESGSGKERIARLLHEESSRASGPLIAVNCGAIAETLLEAELFGHARGAFTGAIGERPGLFEAADGGTLFLDEVGEVTPGMQVKLLRVLQAREVRRVGENRSRKINVRIVAATNRNLAHGVGDGAFRQDLYYRIKVVELHVPPLRERRDDLLPLARVLLAEAAHSMGRPPLRLGLHVAERLLAYHWPGNVRELQNAMERGAALASGDHIELADLPCELQSPGPCGIAAPARVEPLHVVERAHILAVLAANGGNQKRAAEQLEIGLATLYRKLRRYRGG